MAHSVLVTGGAGYVGSHAAKMLVEKGERVVVIDNLVYGHRDALPSGAAFYEGDISDDGLLQKIFTENEIDTVMHFAAFTYVGESVTDPAKYYTNNTARPLTLLDAMRQHGCKRFIFSSTCATYGEPKYVPIDEKHSQHPINPYGTSKFMLETILRDYASAYGFTNAFLRYFNVAGADESAEIGEDHNPETHLIPLVLDTALGRRESISIFGTDYETPDGTCIRDYIHVNDLSRAHIAALDHLRDGGESIALNLGTGQGYSVREIIDAVRSVSGKGFKVIETDRRDGDPPSLVADASLAKEVLGWEAKYTQIEAIVQTAWDWVTGPRGGTFDR